tara:strand:- start:15699 stop:16799 length:1101 start_codon:yes stop_codon:yes gene_type:complete
MTDLKISSSFIKELKQQIIASRYIVAKVANAESLKLYFNIGKMVDDQFTKKKWGTNVMDVISNQLQQELPGLRGFSGKNIYKMRQFYNNWKHWELNFSSATRNLESDHGLVRSTGTSKMNSVDVDSFISVSFTHHYEIIQKIKAEEHQWYYIKQTSQQFWTVKQLRIELKNQSHLQEEKLPNNFKNTLNNSLSNKAMHAFKDQYLLDFVNVEDGDEEMDERVLELEIVQNIKKFLMSLGNDFTFMGNQYRLKIIEDEYFIDLLFFHRGLQSLVAFELKKGKFKPEYVGKMNFYLSALDDLVKQPHENPSIGIILCKEKDDNKVEYSFRDFNKPMGVSVFKTSTVLPEEFKNALPTAEELKGLMQED